ncbi:hypothetical protein A4D02_09090 [Niastella koreensis]|uniref:TOD1/MUCI70 glycosyltransferase-like domain-containing protein n=2 Tax=Niastella koreensis TaxID=354356 RepID=G8TKL4_NIAKG|nr:glycosyltransferase domain-containing protein [Niastella koreensis]AEV98688.1 Protein of unknown function DUF616 [Niastella koreensis GR20-10]OQP44931.1 hypothetical protein A4D02_09090 [Niastella koreensis]
MIDKEKFAGFNGNIVYTAIFGNIKDKLHTRPRQTSPVAFCSFLDAERLGTKKFFNLTKWGLYEAQFKNDHLRRQARAHKILAHKIFPNCRYSLWIDGCFKLVSRDVNGIMEKHLKNADICVFKHRKRNCIYEEVNACIEQQKDDKDTMLIQVTKYKEEGYPANNGLAETTAVLRRHNKAIAGFNEMWWEEISKGSCRDQLSFDYVAWKLGMNYEIFPGNMVVNPYFKWFRH